MPNNKRKKDTTLSSYKTKTYQYLLKNKTKSFTFKQLSRKLNYKNKIQRQALGEALDELFAKGKIDRLNNNTIRISEKESERGGQREALTGIFEHTNPRYGFIVSKEFDDDFKVSGNFVRGAMDGDRVRFNILPERGGRGRGNKREAEIVEIIERKAEEFVGVIEISEKFAFVVPDNRRIYSDIFIPKGQINGAKDREKVVAKIIEWPEGDRNATGTVSKVLGEAGTNDVEMHSILLEYGLPYDFPEKVERAADGISTEITNEEVKQRRDMRNVTTFTIDPVDAKDFDDALSFQELGEKAGKKLYEIGIHIADVSHYVTPESTLDIEAYKRATSVYLVDRVVPMLPENLSNGLCSLRPHEDKLTFSAVFEIDEDGQVHKEWFGRTVTHSNRRFSYEEAQDVLDNNAGDHIEELKVLNDVSKKLRKERFRKGAIKFESQEVRFVLDEAGKPLEVIPKVRKDTHKLIEDFMLLANKKVAEFVFKKRKDDPLTFVYRTHGDPDPDRLANFSNFARSFGYNLNFDADGIAKTINGLVDSLEEKPEGSILQNVAIRAMAKAVYTTEPEGHFGLAFPHYTHFTSPIRRYPDVMVHRLLQHYLDGGKSAKKDLYEEKCEHSSQREKMAADAERASIKYKQVEFMQSMLGEEFVGIVSGISDWGLYVEIIATKCEGMIRISDLKDDYYEADPDNFRIIGKENKRIIRFGDELTVKVTDTNLERRTIDLELVDFGAGDDKPS